MQNQPGQALSLNPLCQAFHNQKGEINIHDRALTKIKQELEH